jgi:GT2 family glycosyltransferase
MQLSDNMTKITIQLITYNSEKYLPLLFASLHKQTFQDWNLLILDNGSTDQTVELVRQELSNFQKKIELIISQENSGFTGGHNILFKKSDSEYVLLLNPDMYLLSDCLEKLVKTLDSFSDAGVVAPRLMKWDFSAINSPGLELSFTDRIDSLGLQVYRSRRVVEFMAGKEWSKIKGDFLSYPERDEIASYEVFGVSGALPLLRRSALEVVKDSRENIFDPLFFMYQEDIDLAFRLREAGYKAYVNLDAIAYHDRTAAMPEHANDFGAAKNKKTQSELVKYHSYKNHLMMLYKNEYWQNLILDFSWIMWYEFKKFAWFLLFNRSVLKGLREVWVYQKTLKNERRNIKKSRKINWKNFRKWWN